MLSLIFLMDCTLRTIKTVNYFLMWLDKNGENCRNSKYKDRSGYFINLENQVYHFEGSVDTLRDGFQKNIPSIEYSKHY